MFWKPNLAYYQEKNFQAVVPVNRNKFKQAKVSFPSRVCAAQHGGCSSSGERTVKKKLLSSSSSSSWALQLGPCSVINPTWGIGLDMGNIEKCNQHISSRGCDTEGLHFLLFAEG